MNVAEICRLLSFSCTSIFNFEKNLEVTVFIVFSREEASRGIAVFNVQTSTMSPKFCQEYFGTLSFEMRSIYACVNCSFSIPLIVFDQVSHEEISFPSSFPSSWHGVKLKLYMWIPLGKWIWFVTSSTWLHDFVWKRFLVCKLHIRHVT